MAATEPALGQPAESVLRAPQTIEETGLSFDLLLQLVTKTLLFGGELSGADLALRLGVAFTVIEPCLEMLKRDQHCTIVGGALLGAASFRYRLTDAGRARAGLFLEQSQYVGRAPVPLRQYLAYMRSVGHDRSAGVSRERVRQAFSHLVVSDRVLDQLGPAIAARHSLFIYGPPGNGKTVLAQAIRNLLAGDIAVPHALSIEGHVVRLFDPVAHEPVPSPPPARSLERQVGMDARWERCRRPLITVGGELTLDALELSYSNVGGFYRAPLQALANGGVLVIDDFGRQHAAPRDLLNRWIVPLESRVDYLTLQTGEKFELPFEVLIVFATNLKPAELVDEAFLRRIQYKVFAESPTVEEFVRIFDNYCRTQRLPEAPGLAEALIERELRPRHVQLRGCQPRDLIDHALSLADYLERPRALTLELLSAACDSYFVDEGNGGESAPGRP